MNKRFYIPKIITIYWCEYSEHGASWVCRLFGVEHWFGIGKTKLRSFLDCIKFNKNPKYPYL